VEIFDLKIVMKCPEKYIKAYIFFLLSNGLSSNLKMLFIFNEYFKFELNPLVNKKKDIGLNVLFRTFSGQIIST
jgi:hypothetical protein